MLILVVGVVERRRIFVKLLDNFPNFTVPSKRFSLRFGNAQYTTDTGVLWPTVLSFENNNIPPALHTETLAPHSAAS